jgi:SAM-dependent methyltransferase
MTYAARTKYDQPGRAARYGARSPRRDAEEWALLERCLAALPPPGSALDVPCGTGRIGERLLDRGIPVRAADLSPAMRRETEARLAGRAGFLGVVALDLDGDAPAEGLEADLVVCFRFLHHLPGTASRHRVLANLARLTRRDLLLSFHHPVSVHNLARGLRRVLTRRRGDRYALTVGRLRREAASAGLVLVGVRALAAWRRDLWVAHLRPA